MIAIGLNIILGMLLVCGLMLGLRLDKRLRGLRDNHDSFAKAVQELDQAAARTESSLADLRAGTEAARTELAARIDQARLLAQRLEKLTADAGRALEQQPEPRPQTRANPLLSGWPRSGAEPASPRLSALADRKSAAPSHPRSRVLVDDDLFDIAGGLDRRAPMAAAMGGRR
jgi:septal ring factor EnvC (AmiA/AmiB activator)